MLAALLPRQLPAMDDADAVQFCLFVRIECVIGRNHVGEARITAIRRQRDRVQDGGQ